MAISGALGSHWNRAGQPRSVIGATVEKIEELLGAGGASLVYAGYPYDPFAPDAPTHV